MSMSDDRRREAAIERRLEQGLARLDAAGPGICPDAEHLALYAEQALADEERATIEAHLAWCATCQDTLVVLAQIDEAPEDSAIDDRVVDDAITRGPAMPGWWRRWRPWPWLVPLPAAAVLAFGVYLAMGPDRGDEPPDMLMARHEPEAATPSMEGVDAPDVRSTTPADVPAPTAAPLTAPGEAGPGPGGTSAGASAPSTVAAPRSALVSKSAGAAVATPSSPAAPGPAVAAATTPVAETLTAEAEPSRDRPADRTPADAPGPALAERTAPMAGVVGGVVSTDGAVAASHEPVDIRTPDPAVVWRIGPGGTLSVSSNGGATWQSVALRTTMPLLAGSCPMPSTCWFVGRRSVIVQTDDGVHWSVVPSPTTDDLVGVEASSRDAAVVRSREEGFSTTDGGRSWRRLAP